MDFRNSSSNPHALPLLRVTAYPQNILNEALFLILRSLQAHHETKEGRRGSEIVPNISMPRRRQGKEFVFPRELYT